MRCLLDTCALIDLVFSPERLSDRAREIIESDSDLFVSIASFWEFVIKQQIGKLNIHETSVMELKAICDDLNIHILQTSAEQIDLIRQLPRIKNHGDPFDRLIISQAQYEKLPVLTSDKKFPLYDIHVIW